jgi:predicted TIM-barrel fold metal-dependent hydrolase
MVAGGSLMIVDYLANCFLPDRRAIWDGAITRAGLPLKVRKGDEDSFATGAEMVARMDELGIAALLLPSCDIGAHGTVDPYDYEHVATRWEEMQQLAADFPGRFAALAVAKPGAGLAAVREVRRRLQEPWVVGMYTHTHSWDLRFDAAEYYPYYALAADEGVAFVMQAGTSGGLMPSECGVPIGIDRPAIYFPDTRFVLSHTGWPWVDEAVSMALKFPNVYLGTGAYPPKHWHPSVHAFIRGPGKRKVLFGTNFPTVGHRHALDQISDLELPQPVHDALVGDTARTVFPRLEGAPG